MCCGGNRAGALAGLIRVVGVRGVADYGCPGLTACTAGAIFANRLFCFFEERVRFHGSEGNLSVEFDFNIEIVRFGSREGCVVTVFIVEKGEVLLEPFCA